MKKIVFLLLNFLILSTFVSCGLLESLFDKNKIREYEGEKIAKLTYTSISFMGDGGRDTYTVDFSENKVFEDRYNGIEDTTENSLINTFTDEEGKSFIDRCYTYGLFEIEERYETLDVCDGGGWKFEILYENGEKFESEGFNAGPWDVFKNCAIAFYDVWRINIGGRLPLSFFNPPKLYMGVEDYIKNNTLAVQADYSWNEGRFVSDSRDYYSINVNFGSRVFFEDIDYDLFFSTVNYDHPVSFTRFILKSYDYNEKMTGEKILISRGWFNRITIPMELDKIYVYELQFENGDYVRYTFNTKSAGLSGEYRVE